MLQHDPDRVTPWTRAQLWAEHDARNQRIEGRLLTIGLLAAWLTSTVATYPWTSSSAARQPPAATMPTPQMQCRIDHHMVVSERMQLRPAASPVVLCVMRGEP
jgi:hypothetical protein